MTKAEAGNPIKAQEALRLLRSAIEDAPQCVDADTKDKRTEEIAAVARMALKDVLTIIAENSNSADQMGVFEKLLEMNPTARELVEFTYVCSNQDIFSRVISILKEKSSFDDLCDPRIKGLLRILMEAPELFPDKWLHNLINSAIDSGAYDELSEILNEIGEKIPPDLLVIIAIKAGDSEVAQRAYEIGTKYELFELCHIECIAGELGVNMAKAKLREHEIKVVLKIESFFATLCLLEDEASAMLRQRAIKALPTLSCCAITQEELRKDTDFVKAYGEWQQALEQLANKAGESILSRIKKSITEARFYYDIGMFQVALDCLKDDALVQVKEVGMPQEAEDIQKLISLLAVKAFEMKEPVSN